MRTPIPRFVIYAVLAAIPWIAGCSQDPTLPERPGQLTGTVLDADGRPVLGANISFTYELVFDDGQPPPPGLTGASQIATADGTLTIYTHLGERVRHLEFEAGQGMVAWDGRDEYGVMVPSSVYRYVLSTEASDGSPLVLQRWLFVVVPDAGNRAATRVTRSNREGWFSVALERIPVWEDYDLRVSGTDGGSRSFSLSRTVTVWAFHPARAEPSASATVALEDPDAQYVVELRLAD